MQSHGFRTSFRKRPSPGRWWAIFCGLLVAVLAPKNALAAGMCDPSGMSVVAPIPALPSITGELTAQKSCESPLQDEMRVGHSRNDAPATQSAPDVPDRIVVALPDLPRIAGRLLERPEAAQLPALPGFTGTVYRPPRAA